MPRTEKKPRRLPSPKVCAFCKKGAPRIDYKDVPLLRRYLNEKGKIRTRPTTGNCTQHQRDMANAIKNAREMALLPYAFNAFDAPVRPDRRASRDAGRN